MELNVANWAIGWTLTGAWFLVLVNNVFFGKGIKTLQKDNVTNRRFHTTGR